MELLSAKRDRPNLSIPVAGNVVKDKHQVAPVRHPGGLLQQGGPRIHGLLFSVRRIEDHDSAGTLTARVKHRSGNRLAIDRPGGVGVPRERKRGKNALAAALGMSWVLLPVAMCRIQRLRWPWPSSVTFTTYLPSGETVASSTLPELVTFSM